MRYKILQSWFLPSLMIICFWSISFPSYASRLNDLDQDIFSYIHSDMNSRFLDKATPIVQGMGDPRFYVGLCAFLCAFGNESMFETGKLSTVGFIESGVLVYVLKTIVERPRPLNNGEKNSFPSGHSTFAFTIATIAGHQYPKLRIPLYLTATGTAFSRVYLGRHYPSDVLIGAIMGTLIGIQVIHFNEPILKLSF